MNYSTRLRNGVRRSGISLFEMLAVVTLLGIIAMVVVPRLANRADSTKANSCFATKGMIEVQAELWLRNKGVAPATDLSDIMADPGYFPDGAVSCPVDQAAYQFDTTTMQVNGHAHADLLD